MLCLKVPKTEGEEVRKKLLDAGIMDNRYKIGTEVDCLLFPLKGELPEELNEYPRVQRELEERTLEVGDYRGSVDIPEELKDELPTSYDMIGSIAVIKIPEELSEYKKVIGRAVLKTHKKITTVMDDKGVTGDFRIRDVELIAGEPETRTVHREYGIELEVDVAKTYFSPRLATERWRIVNEVREGEVVLDMFAGVGPFSILIAKHVKVKHVHAVDINPIAIELLVANAERNGVAAVVEAHLGDAGELSPRSKSDRVIMNLPHSAGDYIEPAVKSLKNGGVIHYYEILPEEKVEQRVQELIEEFKNLGKNAEIIERRLVRTYSPTDVHMAFDIKVD